MSKEKKCRIFLFLVSSFIAVTGFSQGDFSLIKSRIASQMTDQVKQKPLAKTLAVYLPLQQTNGSWKDIPYSDSSITKWKPGEHLERVKSLAIAFIKKDNMYYNSTATFNAVVAALRFWFNADPKSSNWWHNEIATPQMLGEIMILMQEGHKPLPNGLEDSLVVRMKRGDAYAKTGANKLDIAIHYLYRACITHNKLLMDSAVEQAFQPIVFTHEEGLQYDYSYMQHGPQLQISSYGLVFLNGEYKVASWLPGTSYQLSGSQFAMLNNYLVNSFLRTIRGSYIDFNTEGRGISRPDILDKAKIAGDNSLLEIASAMNNASVKAAIDAAIERVSEAKPPSYKIEPSHTHFWKGDYTLHVRPAYSFNVRMASVRTKRTETGNKENLLGKFLPDGSTNIQRSGKEYYNIMPVWEWDKIPGITARDFKTDQPITVQWGEAGSTRFVGGVSDSIYGASAYNMDYNGVKAKKAWFFFDKEVVALGAAIHASEAEHVVSTINQCWSNGKVVVSQNGSINTTSKGTSAGNTDWVWHDSIGYFFPDKNNVFISNATQTGNWSRVNAKDSKEEVAGEVFKMWIDHGSKPSNGSYSYITVPGIDAGSMQQYNKTDVKIIVNSDSVQAVEHVGLKMLQVVFYKPGTVTTPHITLSADQPCIVLLKDIDTLKRLYVADPAQQSKLVTITIAIEANKEVKKVKCLLPQGNLAGSSVSFTIR